MKKIYRYGHRSVKHRHVVAVIFAICVVFFAPIIFFIYNDLKQHGSGQAEGSTQVVGQVVGSPTTKKLEINEPTFAMQLPGDWKESRRITTTGSHTIIWQATKKGQDNRSLQIFVDTIPSSMPVNRLMPVTVQGSGLIAGDISDNCATFTGGGTLDTKQAVLQKPTLAKWQGVDFMCNLPNVVDNQIGVGAVGNPINQVTITGPAGTHKYFFLYTDRNIQPDYTILTDALQSFHAK